MFLSRSLEVALGAGRTPQLGLPWHGWWGAGHRCRGRAEPHACCLQVQSLVSRCTCPVQFSMVKVSEGKYRVGDSSTLIFIRVSAGTEVEGPPGFVDSSCLPWDPAQA